MGIFNLFPAWSKKLSAPDHQIPCPPIITGLSAFFTILITFDNEDGSGQALGKVLGLLSNGRSFNPASK